MKQETKWHDLVSKDKPPVYWVLKTLFVIIVYPPLLHMIWSFWF